MVQSFTDQLHITVEVSYPPKRIVSLVPSQTELLHAIGLEEEVVGITKFCIHPEHWFKNKQRIGGTKTVKINTIRELQPDLVIANKEENVKEQIEELRNIAPVWVSDIENLDDAIEMIELVGKLVGKSDEAHRIAIDIKRGFDDVALPKIKPKTAYLIWKDPLMVAGGLTFINDIMLRGGFDNIFADSLRYPGVTTAQLVDKDCQLLLLSSEPYPFKEKHIGELQQYLPNTLIVLVDGEMFSWYGSRLLFASTYLKSLVERLSMYFN